MDTISTLLFASVSSVTSVLLVALAGAAMVKYRLLGPETVKVLGALVFYAMLPCMLFESSAGIVWGEIIKYWHIPLSALILIPSGMTIGWLLLKWAKAPKEMLKPLIAVCTFSNSGYLPIPLLSAALLYFPTFRFSHQLMITLIALYLAVYSPLLWLVGLHMVKGREKDAKSKIKFFNILPPPVIGLLLGMLFGVLREHAANQAFFLWLAPLLTAIGTIGKGTIPCALILLGASMMSRPEANIVSPRITAAVLSCRLLVMPLIGFLLVWVFRQTGLMAPDDMISPLIIIVESATPAATNLIVMASVVNPKAQQPFAALLFWNYLSAIFSLTLVLLAIVWIFGQRGAL